LLVISLRHNVYVWEKLSQIMVLFYIAPTWERKESSSDDANNAEHANPAAERAQ